MTSKGQRIWTGVRVVLAAVSFIIPAYAGPEEEACLASLAIARQELATLPSADLSRRFAEVELRTAETELNAGEADECEPLIRRARWIMQTRPYVLRPGERLGVTDKTR